MSILDQLRGIQGQKGAPAIPQGGGYSDRDVKLAEKMEKRMTSIEKLVKSSNKHWHKLGEARTLEKAIKSLDAFNKKQEKHNTLLDQGNATREEMISSYSDLAEARKEAIDDTKEHNKQLNEQKGMMGRLQNVLNEMPAGVSLFTAAIRDAGIVMGDMNQGFDIMARSGQVQGKSMGELASATGNYMAQMRLSSIQAAEFGVTAEESNAAFAQLTETYGGVGDKVDEMSEKWSSMSLMAKLSGLGMVDIANLADQGYKKLGETLDDTLNTVKDMTEITGELNNRFGEGSVNSKAFAGAIQEMAYGASFMNQNSRMLTETLGRELQMQLALGKAPEAALKAAQKNMELAGKVNIVGITQFRDGMQAEYDEMKKQGRGEEHLQKLADEFGSEGEVIANMLAQGNLMSSKSLFAFEKAVQNSSALSATMLESMRASASGGNVGDLLAKGLSIQDAQYMVAEANLLSAKLKALAGDKGNEQASKLFGKNWQNDEESVAMVKAARAKGANMQDLQSQFYRMGGAGSEEAKKKLAKEAAAGGESEWEAWANANIEAGWFSGITNSFSTITALLASLPISLGGVIGALLLRKGLGSALGNMGMPGMGGGAAKAPGMMSRGLTAGRGLVNAGGMGGKLARGGFYMAMAYGVGKVAEGMFNASEIMGKADVSGIERLAAGFGNLISAVTGVDARDAATGNTGFHKAIYSALLGNYLDGSNAEDEYANASRDEQLSAQYKSRQARIAGGGPGEAMTEQEWREMIQQRKLRAAQQERESTGTDGTIKEGGTKTGSGNGELQQDGSMVITINNMEQVVAETQYNQSSN